MRFRNDTTNQKDRRVDAVTKGGGEGVGGEPLAAERQNGENTRFINVGMSKVLVAAAQIAALKISRAAMEAKERAAELVTIAAKARKEASEKLQCVSDDHNSRVIMDGVMGVSDFNNGSQSWNHMEAGRSNLIRKDGVLPAMLSRNDVSVAGLGSDRHINGGTGEHCCQKC